MGQRIEFGTAILDVEPRARRSGYEPSADTPFRIALIGDFRGRASRGLRYGPDRLEGCRAWPVDKDDFHTLLERVGPAIETPAGPLELRDMDDFHPDALYAQAPVFVELRRLRKLLRDPDGFRAAARELLASSPENEPAPPPTAQPADGGSVLDAILSGGAGAELPAARPAAKPAAAPQDAEWKSFLRGIVAPHVVPKADPRQQELLAQLDEAVLEQMRLTLHNPAFQSVEACWRSAFLLLDRLETGVELKIDLIDLSRAEVLEDLAAAADELEESGLYRLLVDEGAGQPGAQAFSAVAWLESAGDAPDELTALRTFARIGAQAGAPILVSASPKLVGRDALDRDDEPRGWSFQAADPELEAAYLELRKSPEAHWLALSFPRFLLRTPYGEEGSSTDLPGFEELSERPKHDEMLWGAGPAALACLLGEAFMRSGWELRPGAVGLLDRRPVWHVGKGADREMVPGAEVWLTDAAVERVVERGLSPLVSVKGRDAIAAPRLQSAASPPAPLAGPWD
ncbi:MAG: type VI secretion system contractile sheath large subunit [Acidobacteria bacterium]|nr:type VI secretion system contractile sheath large subunit [Acidobacteriota bacterium]